MKNKKILITVTDITRPCPDKLILDVLLRYLISKGANKKNIKILIANGLHRRMTKKEIFAKYGKRASQLKIKNHNAVNAAELHYFGKIGNVKIFLNKAVKEADVIFSVGLIEPHHYAGFSGGAKSIAIGLAGEQLINHTHSYKFITQKGVSLGNVENNPFQKFLWSVLNKTGKVFYYVNVVLRYNKIIDCAAGFGFNDYCSFIRKKRGHFIYKCGEKYDAAYLNISGAKASNFYQASRAFTYLALSPRPVIKNGAFVVLNSEMKEGFGQGLGEKRFEYILKKSKNLEDLIKNVKGKKCGGMQRAILFSRALCKYKLIITGSKTDLKILEKFGVKIIDKINVGTGRDPSLRGKKNIKIIKINDPFERIYYA